MSAVLARHGYGLRVARFRRNAGWRAHLSRGQSAGQFLWLEERAGLPLLDIVTEYLIAARPDFRYDGSPAPANWKSYQEATGNDIDAMVGDHIVARGGLRIFPDD